MSQKSDILKYIQTHGSITPKEADRKLGCMRLAPRILELKREGHAIEDLNKTGNANYAKYALVAEIAPLCDSHSKVASKVDRINKRLSEDKRLELIDRCKEVLLAYPEGHKEGKSIEIQILELGGRVK